MKNKWAEVAVIFVLPVVLIILDFKTKYLASGGGLNHMDWGLIKFYLIYNKGVIFGSFSDLPNYLRVVAVSTVYGPLIFLYALINYFLYSKAFITRLGLSIFMGGISGNAIERIVLGKVTDFIYFNLHQSSVKIFNVADVFQWIGVIIIIYGLYKEDKALWFENDMRGTYLVNKNFQVKLSLQAALFSLVTAIILGIFSFTFLKVTVETELEYQVLKSFVISYLGLAVVQSIFIFCITIVISNKMAGPIFAFQRYVSNSLLGEKQVEFRLRERDYFKNLVGLANKISVRLGQLNSKNDKDKIE